MRTFEILLVCAASALVLGGPASAQSTQPASKDLIQLAQRGPDSGRGGGGGGGGRGGGGGPPPSASPGPRGGGGPGPRAGRGGGGGPRVHRGDGGGPRVRGGDGGSLRGYRSRGGDGGRPRIHRDRSGPRHAGPPPRARHHHRPGRGFRPSHIRRHGRHFVWGGLPFWFYGGYYYGDCDWLYRRAVETGSAYWWDRYDQCRYWDW